MNINVRKTFIRSLIKLLIFSIIASFLAVLIAEFIVVKTSKERLYNTIEMVPKNKVGVVLGTSKWLVNGSINYYFKYRIDAAVELYKANKIEFILVSGDNGHKSYNEPKEFKKELIKRGIPEDKIYLDYAGFRTLDSVVRAKEVFGEDTFTVISQRFHNERAIFLGLNNQINIVGFNARDLSTRAGIKIKIREYFARVKAVLDIFFGMEPKFLGEKIRIE